MAEADFIGTVSSVSAITQNADNTFATFALYRLTRQPPEYVSISDAVFAIGMDAPDAHAMVVIATAAFVSGQRLNVGLVTPWKPGTPNKMDVAWMQLEQLKP